MAIGTITVDVTANTAPLSKGMKRARKEVKSFGSSIKGALSPLKSFAAALVGIGGATMAVRTLNRVAGEIDKIAKTSDKLGIATEELMGLHHAAELTGIEVRTFDMGLQRAVRRIAEAARGTGEAKDALKELELSAANLSRMAPEQMMGRIADAMNGVANQGDRVRLAMKLFDSEGVALVNTLALGSRGLREAREEAEALGMTFDRDAAAGVEKFNDEIKKLKAAMGGDFMDMVIDISKPAADAVEGLVALMKIYKNRPKEDRVGIAGGAKILANWALFENPLSLFGATSKLEAGLTNRWTERGEMVMPSDAAKFNRVDPEAEFRKSQRKGMFPSVGKSIGMAFIKEVRKTKHLASVGRSMIGQGLARAGDAIGNNRDRNGILRGFYDMFGLNDLAAKAQAGAGGGRRGPSSAIRSNTMEGFTALRANMRGGGKQDVKDLLKQQLEAMKGENGTNTLLQKVIDLFAADQGIELGIPH